MKLRLLAKTLAMALVLPALVASSAYAADQVALSERAWDSMLPLLSQYRKILLEYNKDTSADAPWFEREARLDLSNLEMTESTEDQQALAYWKGVTRGMARLRGAHQTARGQIVHMFSRERTLSPLELTMLQGMAFSIAQAYDEWVTAHEGLLEILKRRRGYRLGKPYAPLILKELQVVAFPKLGNGP